ncbi:MAG: response regulator transcription factor [Cyanobacteria bacterium SZAS-4]|nr:response regulator transcription factor [Cyanobacteria bacterium SZAS-4]
MKTSWNDSHTEVVTEQLQANCTSILLVEDEPEMASIIRAWLQSQSYKVDVVPSGEVALESLQRQSYDLVILDWMLPGVSGLEVCQRFRATRGDSLIIMLTNKSKITEKTLGLDSGADDYLTKPFNLRELSARIRALLRRPRVFKGFIYRVGSLELDSWTFKFCKNGEEISLLPREFALLEFLMRHPDCVFSPEEILNNVWASEAQASPDTIRTYVKNIRKKLDRPGRPSVIKTIHSVGYRLESEHA